MQVPVVEVFHYIKLPSPDTPSVGLRLHACALETTSGQKLKDKNPGVEYMLTHREKESLLLGIMIDSSGTKCYLRWQIY